MTVGEIINLVEVVMLMRGERVILPPSVVDFDELEIVTILEDMGFARKVKRVKC